MSETMNGTIAAVKGDKKAVKIGDGWYSSRNASTFQAASKGDTICFQYETNGRWNNVIDSTVSVAPGGGNSGASSGSTSGGGGKKSDQFRTREEIIRTTSLDASVAFHKDVDPADYGDSIEKILKTSHLFTAYVMGRIDVDALDAKPEDEAANAAIKAEAEAAELERLQKDAEVTAAVQAEEDSAKAPSALSSFLGKS